ncbi:MAG: tRNA (guanosine(37)-N1)-methyltransferase TrmD [Eubacteriales bacterium]|nr:tRNA (guanosine(37)-N1)-methyltransferase TrmD [Eubacteriales bacterium]
MRIDIITLFPEMCEAVLSESIIGRARKDKKVEIVCHQLRDFAFDKHRRVDDAPYGGGMGMLMMAEPIALCFENICETLGKKPYFVYMSPKGETITQQKVKTMAAEHENICILCGHYEGVDQRVLDMYVDEELSIGDYVLTGGELPALVLADSLSRMLPGVLSSDECFELESHYNGLLEYPQYTRPEVWREEAVPPVLMSGHHANIEKWRRQEAIRITHERRPDILESAELSKKEALFLKSLEESEET